MADLIPFFLLSLTALFVVVDPLAIIPIFASLTQGRPPAEIARIARRATLAGATLLVIFAFVGRPLLDALGVSLDAFRVAGALLLLVVAFEMVRGRGASCRCSSDELEDARGREDIAIVPIAMPLLAGPGAMATVMMLLSRHSGPWATPVVLLAIAITFAAAYLALRAAAWLQRLLGRAGLAMAQRVLGLVLAAMAIQSLIESGLALLRHAGVVA